jgi:hypothetical protein
MSKTQLSSSEIQDLINRYLSELKKLEFQVDDVKITIVHLENLLESVNGREKSAVTKVKAKKLSAVALKPASPPALKGKRGRPRKIKAKTSVSQKPSKKETKKGYKLSSWDQYVIDSINQAGKVLITQEIIDFVKNKTMKAGLNSSDEEVKNKVTRSLQKLANRRNDIAKIAYKGKGFAYALPDWLNPKGKLDNKFKR